MTTKLPIQLLQGTVPGAFVGRDETGATNDITSNISLPNTTIIPHLEFIDGTTLRVNSGYRYSEDYSQELEIPTINKTLSAWAMGDNQGGLTDSLVSNTWYYVFIVTDGVDIDIAITNSKLSPTLPLGFTVFNYLGAIKVNSTSEITPFFQRDQRFYWNVQKIDYKGGTAVGGNINFNIDVPAEADIIAHIGVMTQLNGTYNIVAIAPQSVTVRAGSYMAYASIYANTSKGIITKVPLNQETGVKLVVTPAAVVLNVEVHNLGWEDIGAIQ